MPTDRIVPGTGGQSYVSLTSSANITELHFLMPRKAMGRSPQTSPQPPIKQGIL